MLQGYPNTAIEPGFKRAGYHISNMRLMKLTIDSQLERLFCGLLRSVISCLFLEEAQDGLASTQSIRCTAGITASMSYSMKSGVIGLPDSPQMGLIRRQK